MASCGGGRQPAGHAPYSFVYDAPGSDAAASAGCGFAANGEHACARSGAGAARTPPAWSGPAPEFALRAAPEGDDAGGMKGVAVPPPRRW